VHRKAAAEAGHAPGTVPLSINAHGFIADSLDEAVELSFAPTKEAMDRIGRERGWQPMTRDYYEAMASLRGAYFVGGPDEVVEKILFHHELFGHQRFLLKLSTGTFPHEQMLRAIELLGREVAPRVRAELARRAAAASDAPPA
jgi:alkanesulfonate monooxygenase SsuD/methylene tetrahydromethanopterin reductase-like flavin-dependent oxidoreductase (luciferase family)